MPHKAGNKWRWGNVKRGSKEDLRKTVYGIWMKNGAKGSFSKFWKTGKVNESENGTMTEEDIGRLFEKAVRDYAVYAGIDLGYMKFKVDAMPVLTDGRPCLDKSPDECAGDWTGLGWIRLNPDVGSVKARYGIADVPDAVFMESVIRHELAHEVWRKPGLDGLKRAVLERASAGGFTTAYLETVPARKLREETFCEYMAVNLETLAPGVEFKKVERAALLGLLDKIDSYTANPRWDRSQFEKYLYSEKTVDAEDKSMFYGAFADGECLALSYLNKVPDRCVLIAQVTAVVKGFGAVLIRNIMSRAKDMWWAADPEGGEGLLAYYRKNFWDETEEVELPKSKWPATHFFVRASGKGREDIMAMLEKARA